MGAKSFLSVVTLVSILVRVHAKFHNTLDDGSVGVLNEVRVGVILDMGSWEGRTIHSCISMALSDFYTADKHYKTRVKIYTKNSKGEPLHALSAALDLLENAKVEAIIGAQTSVEAKFLRELGHKAKVPVISFSPARSSRSSTKDPYVVEIAPDETSQADSLASLVEVLKWRDVILIYEDTEQDIFPFLVDSFQEKNIRITCRTSVTTSSNDDQLIHELNKLMASQSTVFILHVSHFLISRILLTAKKLGLLSEGHAWILTAKSMHSFQSMNSSVLKSMQGVIGLRSYFPASEKLSNFTSRWRRKFLFEEPDLEVPELNALGVWAYDVAWSLAIGAERVRVKTTRPVTRFHGEDLRKPIKIHSSMLLEEILQSGFKGLSGEFQFINGRVFSSAYEIINVIGSGERIVGYWSTAEGKLRREIEPTDDRRSLLSSSNDLGTIVWPGESATVPKGWITRSLMSGDTKLRIGVPVLSGFEEFVKVDRDIETNKTTITGFCIDVFEAAIATLPYEIHYELIPFMNATGQMAGNYDDLVYQVYLRNYDAVVGDVTIMAKRLPYVDFTLPFTDIGVGMVVRNDKKNMWIFLKPLSKDLWLTCAVFFVLTGFVVWIIEHPVNNEFQGSPSQQIGMIFWFSLSTLVFAQREKLMSNLSRFVVIVWMFLVLILTSSYTAILSSMLTVQQINLESRTDFVGYEFDGYIRGASKNISVEDYITALSDRRKQGGVPVVIDEIPYIKNFLAKYPNKYSMVSQKPITNGFGFVFPKGSPLVHDISKAIAKLREEGILETMEKSWFDGHSSFATEDSESYLKTLSFGSFRGLFLISGASLTLALLLHCACVLRANWHVLRNWKPRDLIARLLEFRLKVKVFPTSA